MEMTKPAPPNALDENRHGQIGRPLDRVDGVLKVTGRAPYAYEVKEGEAPAYGWIVEASIPKGRIAELDTAAAEAAPGVLLVLSHKTMPPQGRYSTEVEQRFERAVPYMNDDRIIAYGEPVALVVAETLEQARAAAALIQPRYEVEHGDFDLQSNLGKAEKPSSNVNEPDSAVGDFARGYAKAPVKLDVIYTTPFHIHAQMEPHATLASWEGDRVVIHCSTQMVEHAQARVAATLQIPKEKVRIVSRYIGGGFGGKLPVFADVLLSAQASRKLGRPVKTALTRQQMFHITTHRSRTIQRLRLGATRDGVLQAIGHEAWSHSARYDDFYETAAVQTRSLYAAAHRMTQHRVCRLDLPRADSCRAPYAYEVKEGDAPAYGWIVEASIAKGRIAELDTAAAEAAPGVLLVLSHKNMPPQGRYSTDVEQRFERAVPYMNDDRVIAYGEPVALVVAETLEQARAAAALIRPRYEAGSGDYDLQSNLGKAEKPSSNVNEPDSAVGDFAQGYAEAPVKLDVIYTTPFHIHAQMEPHATLAWWEGDRVVIHCSTQMVEHAQARVAATLQIPKEKVRIVSRYIGGGFGGKLPVFADVL
ncbi:MAG TPA: molybdopterin cofactor-binding domain-containing protein, partial [Ramlibacter sp.]